MPGIENRVKRLEESKRKSSKNDIVVFVDNQDFESIGERDRYITTLSKEYRAKGINPIFFIDDIEKED